MDPARTLTVFHEWVLVSFVLPSWRWFVDASRQKWREALRALCQTIPGIVGQQLAPAMPKESGRVVRIRQLLGKAGAYLVIISRGFGDERFDVQLGVVPECVARLEKIPNRQAREQLKWV